MTQEPTPDTKCMLIISSFLTVTHLLDCLICMGNAMSILLLLQKMGRWNRWVVVHLNYGVDGETGGEYHLTVFFSLSFYILLSHFLSPFI